jgi:5'-nucleotidase
VVPVLKVMVTNDDGVGAPGINAVTQALRQLPHTKVVVVAPATNQSGTGGTTTPGVIKAKLSATAAGYPAVAVEGTPADTITWAVTQKGVPYRPDLVVSGVNFGQNLGPLADDSGTVGAARAAVAHGIAALAASQGVDNGAQPDFAEGAAQVVAWVQHHRAALLHHAPGAPLPQGNLNVPTCPAGHVRGPVHAPAATTLTGRSITTVDCASTSTSFSDDVGAFVIGYAVISPLS